MFGRLQFVHTTEPFSSKELAHNKIKELTRTSIIGEPIVVTYYNNSLIDDLQLVIAIGKGVDDNGRSLGYHIIDTKEMQVEYNTAFANAMSMLNAEIQNRKDSDDSLNSIINTILEDVTNLGSDGSSLRQDVNRNKIVNVESNTNSVKSVISEKDNGTTISLDVLVDNTTEFLKYDDHGLTDKGIKSYVSDVVETSKTELNDVISKKETSINSNIESVNSSLNKHIENVKTLHVTEEERSRWNRSSDDIEYFLQSSSIGEEVIDTLKEIQQYINTDGDVASKMLDDIAKNAEDIETLRNDISFDIDALDEAKVDKVVFVEEKNANLNKFSEISDLFGSEITKENNTTSQLSKLKNDKLDVSEFNTFSNNLTNRIENIEEDYLRSIDIITESGERKLEDSKLLDKITNIESDYVSKESHDLSISILNSEIDNRVLYETYNTKVNELEKTDVSLEIGVNNLKTLVGDSTVADQIDSKLSTLTVADGYVNNKFVSAVVQTNGKINVIRTDISSVTKDIITSIESNTEVINKNAEDILSLESKINDSVTALETEDVRLEGLIESVDAGLVSNSVEINLLKEKVTELEAELSKNIEKIETIDALESRITLLSEANSTLNSKVLILENALKRILGVDDFETDENTYAITSVQQGQGDEIMVTKDKNNLVIDFNSDILGGIIED